MCVNVECLIELLENCDGKHLILLIQSIRSFLFNGDMHGSLTMLSLSGSSDQDTWHPYYNRPKMDILTFQLFQINLNSSVTIGYYTLHSPENLANKKISVMCNLNATNHETTDVLGVVWLSFVKTSPKKNDKSVTIYQQLQVKMLRYHQIKSILFYHQSLKVN